MFQSKIFRTIIYYILIIAVLFTTAKILGQKGLIPFQNLHSKPFASNAVVNLIFSNPDNSKISAKEKKQRAVPSKNFQIISSSPLLNSVLTVPSSGYSIVYPTNSFPLDTFYEKLTANLERSNRLPVKAALFGDSVVAGDIFPEYFRRKIQNIFGYGGPGFVCMAKPYRYYFNNDIKWDPTGDWSVASVFDKMAGFLGINGFCFTGSNGASALFNSPTIRGKEFNRANLYYLAYPRGKFFEVTLGSNKILMDSCSRTTNLTMRSFPMQANSTLKISCKNRHWARFYGVEFVNTNKGFVLDTFPVQGGNSGHQLRISENSWKSQMGQLQPDIAIVMYDINLSGYTNFPRDVYIYQFGLFINRIRLSNPRIPILIVSPMARSEKKGHEIKIMPAMTAMINAQETVSKQMGCAFIDLYEALGGKNGLAEWYGTPDEMLGADLIHLTYKGADRLSSEILSILISDYKEFLVRRHYLKTSPSKISSQRKNTHAL